MNVAFANQPSLPESAEDNSSPGVAHPRVAANESTLGRNSRGRRFFRYGALLLFSLLLIWGSTLGYLSVVPDRFRSEWTLIIPGAGTGSSVNLDNLGQASTSVTSAYATSRVDPKVNYKAIALSQTVLGTAAASLGMSVAEFGKPKVNLIDQTTLLEFSIDADTAEAALSKSSSYYNALENELSRLRNDELKNRRQGNTEILSSYRANVESAQAELLRFQNESTVVSSDQYQQMAIHIEELKQKKADAVVRHSSISAHLSNLSAALDINAEAAADAIKLQNDPIFQSILEQLSSAQSELVERQAVWGNKHPKVRHSSARVNAVTSALRSRAKTSISLADIDSLNDLMISGDSDRAQLFNEIISQRAKQHAVSTEIETYDQLTSELQLRLRENTERIATLQDLERSHQVATAVFVSAVAKADLGKSDIFASYPMTQMLVSPTLPSQPESLHKALALAGATAGSLFILLSLVIGWHRYALLHKTLKND